MYREKGWGITDQKAYGGDILLWYVLSRVGEREGGRGTIGLPQHEGRKDRRREEVGR